MKKVLITTLFLFFVFAQTTFAHTDIKMTTPSDGQIIEGNVNELTLVFETPIESKSIVTLTDENGEEIPLSISVNNDTMIAKIETPLENGTYEVKWNIIGEDGHPMSGSYLFMVNNTEPAEAATETGSEEGSSFNWFVIFIGALVIIVILSLVTKPNKGRRRRF